MSDIVETDPEIKFEHYVKAISSLRKIPRRNGRAHRAMLQEAIRHQRPIRSAGASEKGASDADRVDNVCNACVMSIDEKYDY